MYHSFVEVFAVVGSIHLVGPRLVQVAVVIWGHDAQALLLLSVSALYQLVNNSTGRITVSTTQNKDLFFCSGNKPNYLQV